MECMEFLRSFRVSVTYKHFRIVSLTSTCMLASKLNIDDLNMDNTNFGFLNSLPYNNTKCMLALYTKELGKQLGVNAYAVCPAIVNTQIFNDCPWLFRLSIRMSRLFSFTPDEVVMRLLINFSSIELITMVSGCIEFHHVLCT